MPAFAIVIGLLTLEGFLAATLLRAGDRWLRLALALPLASLLNVLLVFAATLAGVPLTAWSFGLAHGCGVAALGFAVRLARPEPELPAASPAPPLSPGQKLLAACCALLIGNALVFGLVHATVLPPFGMDTLTNWTMRAKVSFTDRAISFDRDERRGVAKPQYPFLLHALQVAANQGRVTWSDRAAHAATFLLDVSGLAAAALLLRRMRGGIVAIVTLALLATAPLFSIHLMQGYGDVHVVTFFVVSFLGLALWMESGGTRWLALSALAVAAAAWTKFEGTAFGLLPWTMIVLLEAGLRRRRWKLATAAAALPWLLIVPFFLFLFARGLALTPHGEGAALQWHPEAAPLLAFLPVSYGSFGILWIALPVALALLLRRLPPARRPLLPLLGWIGWTLGLVAFVYLCTRNVEGLLNGQGFFRQMLSPTALLLCACALFADPASTRLPRGRDG